MERLRTKVCCCGSAEAPAGGVLTVYCQKFVRTASNVYVGDDPEMVRTTSAVSASARLGAVGHRRTSRALGNVHHHVRVRTSPRNALASPVAVHTLIISGVSSAKLTRSLLRATVLSALVNISGGGDSLHDRRSELFPRE